MGGPLEGWRVASKRLGALPRIKRGALGRGCGREGSGALPLARAAGAAYGEREVDNGVREIIEKYLNDWSAGRVLCVDNTTRPTNNSCRFRD